MFHPQQYQQQQQVYQSTMNPASVVGYRGRCRYKSGRCQNERTLKYNGEEIHSLCEEHRIRHNRNQRKADTKRRKGKNSANLDEIASVSAVSPMSNHSAKANHQHHDSVYSTASLFEHTAILESTADDNVVFHVEDDLDLYLQDECPTWSNEDVAILMEFFVDTATTTC
ncbi:unnamed protein product [Aphanomyces euteiches]